LRIIAGRHKGATIYAPSGMRTRPTADKVRGAVFNMLGSTAGLAVLDLFAGSGALGLEALSRGASRVVFVENQAGALKAINRNLGKLTAGFTDKVTGNLPAAPADEPAALRAPDNVEIRRRDYLAYLRFAAKKGERFDLIFIDPPYRMHRVIEPALARWIPAVLSPGGRVVVESDARSQIVLRGELLSDRLYGDTRIRIFSIP